MDEEMKRLNMERVLASEKPEDFRGFDKSGKQICLRCYEFYAREESVFCEKCHEARAKVDKKIVEIGVREEEKRLKDLKNVKFDIN